MMVNKLLPFSVSLCCFLFASVIFVPQGTVGRSLLKIQEDGKGQSKAYVPGHPAAQAHGWASNNPPPPSRVERSRGVKRVESCDRRINVGNRNCPRGTAGGSKSPLPCSRYNRGCRRAP
ncbi:hypothetical protein DITRI_Ditri17bG0101700 [Diplodiscus trichospermus]